MKSFKEFLIEYEISASHVAPSHVNEKDIETDKYHKHELGDVEGHTVSHYHNKKNGSHYTFVKNKAGETVGHIEHKKPTVPGRLAISNVTRRGDNHVRGLMAKTLHHLTKHGYTLESDNTNTEGGADKMLMSLAQHHKIHSHIEDGKGNKVPHVGDITSDENRHRYTIKSSDKDFLENNKHKKVLVFHSK